MKENISGQERGETEKDTNSTSKCVILQSEVQDI